MDVEKLKESLASSQGRRDEELNIKLAEEIVASKEKSAIKELVVIVNGKNAKLQNDAIKVIYEAGERNASLICDCMQEMMELLNHKNNRVQWGAMTALNAMTSEIPDKLFSNLVTIIDAADKGSVITRDQAMKILFKLSVHKNYQKDVMSLIFEQLRKCPTNQLPMYAEELLVVISNNYKSEFVKILSQRISEIEKESKRKRIEKVIKKST